MLETTQKGSHVKSVSEIDHYMVQLGIVGIERDAIVLDDSGDYRKLSESEQAEVNVLNNNAGRLTSEMAALVKVRAKVGRHPDTPTPLHKQVNQRVSAHLRPECCTFIGSYPQAQDVLDAFHVHTDSHVDRLVDDASVVTDFYTQGIKEDNWIKLVELPGLPRGDFL